MQLYTKDQILEKIAVLQAYSEAKDARTAALFTSLISAANTYYGDKSAVSAALEDVVKYMYNDISRRMTLYEHEFDAKLPTNFPVGYEDIRDCFANLEEVMTVSEATFYAAFVFGPDPVTGVTGPRSNSYIDSWTELLTSGVADDLANVKTLADWCCNSGGSSDVIDLVEDKGNEVFSLSREEIVNQIYIDANLAAVIDVFGLSTYVPSYL